jgi:ubiquinone/menaquinone biosynthesis C-methylase UbiE
MYEGLRARSKGLWARIWRRYANGLTDNHNYNPVARPYELMARWYSLGRIGASKAWQIQFLMPGDRALYCGVGTGEDAVLAARHGAKVTCIDLSDKMLDLTRRRFEAEGLDGEFICSDAAKWQAPEAFDAVVANYFFNIFDGATTSELMDHLVSFLKPGGKFMVADFMSLRGTGIGRLIQDAYRVIANWLYWAAGLAHLGPTPEYPELFAARGLDVAAIEEFPLTKWGPRAFWAVVAVKP